MQNFNKGLNQTKLLGILWKMTFNLDFSKQAQDISLCYRLQKLLYISFIPHLTYSTRDF